MMNGIADKCRVGIVPSGKLFETSDPYLDIYTTVNSYPMRVREHGGVPVGLLPVNGHLDEDALALCDAIVICGGRRIFPYHFEAVDHAFRTGKRLLGVCLGMQTIHSYFITRQFAAERGWQGSLLELYEQLKRERYMFTDPIEHHWDNQPDRDDIDIAKHTVTIVPGTHLHALLGRERVNAVTLHRYQIGVPAREITVSAGTPDGCREGIEYGKNIIGVQFHPEADGENGALFEFICSGD